uniref:Uncharacterized protein n=1 Tax=Vitis vinifera TaxID=29760 RepID=F6HJ15_VITVI
MATSLGITRGLRQESLLSPTRV